MTQRYLTTNCCIFDPRVVRSSIHTIQICGIVSTLTRLDYLCKNFIQFNNFRKVIKR